MQVRRVGPTILVVTLVVLLMPAMPGYGAGKPARRIVVDGPITPAVADFIESAINDAADAGASALVIELDTPGGLLNSTKTIVKDILGSEVPVLIYIAPGGAGATSAGVFITMSAHVAAMAPGTTIGAAHPVGGQGQDIKGDMREKVENYAVSFIESIARQRGRNVEWVEKAVRESVSISETQALEKHVVDFVASDLSDLFAQAQGKEIELAGKTVKLDLSGAVDSRGGAVVEDVEMTLRQRVLSVITDPSVAYLLMMAGMLGLYMEFAHPGTVFPGVMGAICLLLALLAGQVLPINSTGVLLLLLGMGFFVGELLMPSFGMLGVGGIIAITLGSLFLYTPESGLYVDPKLIVATVSAFGLVLLFILMVLVRDRRRQAMTGAEGLVGEQGVAVTSIAKTGKIRVHGEFWNAFSKTPIDSGRPVRVLRVDRLRVEVAEAKE